MDGFKKRLNTSLQFRLSFILSIIIAAVAVIAGVFSFSSTLDETNELQDDVLYQIAELMDQQHLILAPDSASTSLADGDDDSYIIIQRLASPITEPPRSTSQHPLLLPIDLSDGLHTLKSHGSTYRVLVKTQPSGERIAIAQEADFRDKIARESALRTLMPFLILMPILLLIVTHLVRQMFQPIAGLSREIDRRSFEDLRPVPDHHLPTEVRPFIIAINRLLIRLARSREAQRRFVADAAHELRSPMTALSLQAERLDESDLPPVARERLTVLRQGIQRGRNLLDQLLSLAKAQSAAEPEPSLVSIPTLYRRVLEDLMPQAQAKHIDLGVTSVSDIQTQTNALDLSTLIRNLVDNAIRYTPAGGRVDLSACVRDDMIELCVVDTGPGIPLQERKRIFDPFYRILGTEQLGSGLGLAIVKTIATRLNADIALGFSDAAAQTGLKVTIRLRQNAPA
ncbi:ATP-binding protein [Castellaniella sp.]|uniref:ATP-binding protein n=1 Tax=Castellaniella sp. TaxID=1955812 RepID=UPI002AFED8F5|nr:ATP-binding protein [Castellaniella sp.]